MLDLSQAFQDDIYQPFTWEGTKPYCAVLVHGFPGTPHETRPIGEVLHNLGWTVHGLLLPGFGIEINTLPEKTYAEWLSAVLNAINHFKLQYKKVVLIGFSMGAAISIQAATSSELDALVLLAPFWKIEHILWTLLPAIRVVLPNFKPFRLFPPNFNDPEFRMILDDWLPSADIDDPSIQAKIKDFAIPTSMMNQIRIAGDHARQSAPHIRIPTTIIQGRQDELVKPNLTQTLIQNMTTNVDYIVVDGDHNLTDIRKPHWDNVAPHIHQFAVQFEQENPYE